MPSSHRHTTGFRRNATSLGIDYEGDAIATISGSGINVLTGEALTIDSGATLTITGTMSGAGTVNLASATVTLPTRSAFFDCSHKLLGADGAALAATETAGDFFRPVGTNQLWIQGEATISETEVSVGYFTFVLPENYVSGGTITLRAACDLVGAGTDNGSTVDFSAYLMSEVDGSVGSDLVTTMATAVTTTGAAKDFTVTPTGLVAGNTLVVKLTSSCIENAGMALAMVIYKLGVVCQVNL